MLYPRTGEERHRLRDEYDSDKTNEAGKLLLLRERLIGVDVRAYIARQHGRQKCQNRGFTDRKVAETEVEAEHSKKAHQTSYCK